MSDVREVAWDERAHAEIVRNGPVAGRQGRLMVSRCVSRSCQAFAVWVSAQITEQGTSQDVIRLVYPQTGVRVPPAEGLKDDEAKLYDEAAAVAAVSSRAACALLRVLLEAFLKRHLVIAGPVSRGQAAIRPD